MPCIHSAQEQISKLRIHTDTAKRFLLVHWSNMSLRRPSQGLRCALLYATCLVHVTSAVPSPIRSETLIDQDFALDVEESTGEGAWPAAPGTLPELLQWAPQLLQRLLTHLVGGALRANLQAAFRDRVMVVTDYSGFGSPEIALSSLASALQADPGSLTFWRASDLLESRRRMLLAGEGNLQAQHIFVDLAQQRVSARTRRRLQGVHSRAKREFEQLMELEGDGAVAAKAVGLGQRFMASLQEVMEEVVFNLAGAAWCYKCQKRCPIHPTSIVDDPVVTTVAIAGTTCTSWSAIGHRRKWLAESALPFMIWAYEALAAGPDIIIHECTPRFDYMTLVAIFGSAYFVMSLVFTPMDLGYPCSRPRRWTVLLKKGRRRFLMPLGHCNFPRLFLRSCVVGGHIFGDACATLVERYIAELASARGLPPQTHDGQPWQPQQVLSQGFFQRLLCYERFCRRLRLKLKYILNLHQNVTYMSSLSRFVPTILTKTMLLWSMVYHRMMHPLEYMQVMGIPVLQPNDPGRDRSGFEVLALAGLLDSGEVVHACGNGMVQIAVGSICLFALGSARERLSAIGSENDFDQEPEI